MNDKQHGQNTITLKKRADEGSPDPTPNYVTEELLVSLVAKEREELNHRLDKERQAMTDEMNNFQAMTMKSNMAGVEAAVNSKLQSDIAVAKKATPFRHALTFGITVLASAVGAYVGHTLYDKYGAKKS